MFAQLLLHLLTIISTLKAILEFIKQRNLQVQEDSKPDIEEELLQTHQLEKIFNVTGRTIYSWRKTQQLKFMMIGGTAYYKKSDVYDFKNTPKSKDLPIENSRKIRKKSEK
jgi:hypothetical protein